MRPKLKLTMVESKVRKAAFLREAIRILGLKDAIVENVRIEALAETGSPALGSAAIVTVRAIRVDPTLLRRAADLLAPNGRLVLFRPGNSAIASKYFEQLETVQLTDERPAYAALLRRVFHVEQTR
jgi:16S rRNA G527 N7-methylase RsmG